MITIDITNLGPLLIWVPYESGSPQERCQRTADQRVEMSEVKQTDSRLEDSSRSTPSDLRLLVVDNEAAHARAMTESLEKVGYSCQVATSGPEAASLIEQESYDIVITDMVMNDVDGMKILGLARERLPDSEVVMVTGHATVPIAVEAMQQGASTFWKNRSPPIACARLSKRPPMR